MAQIDKRFKCIKGDYKDLGALSTIFRNSRGRIGNFSKKEMNRSSIPNRAFPLLFGATLFKSFYSGLHPKSWDMGQVD